MPVYVADAHALAWYFTDDARLGAAASALFDRSAAGELPILVPSIVLAELFHVVRKGRLPLAFPDLLARVTGASNLIVTALDLAIIKLLPSVDSLPELHDQIIVATALHYHAALLTKDEAIRESGLVETVW